MQKYRRTRRKTAGRRSRTRRRVRTYKGGARKKKVAILFFGLTRALKKTIENYKKHLFNILTANGIDYDIFIHTYIINGPYHNMWTNEHTESYLNEDVEGILHPKYSLKDDQGAIAKTIPFDDYYTKLGNWTGMSADMTKYLIRNMCLALYSKKQVTKKFEEVKGDYDYAIIIRPDLYLQSPFDVNWLQELNDSNVIVPEKDWFTGCNDRLCIGTPSVIVYCGTLFDSLLEYSKNTSIVSERFFMDKLKEKNLNILKKNIEYETLRMHSQPTA
jgi:hypothetical protein